MISFVLVSPNSARLVALAFSALGISAYAVLQVALWVPRDLGLARCGVVTVLC